MSCICERVIVGKRVNLASIEENRFIDIGTSDKNRLLVVSYTEREDRIRIISVRKANPMERKMYE